MENYNKQLYNSLVRMIDASVQLRCELETVDPKNLSRIKRINQQLKNRDPLIREFEVYKKYIDDLKSDELILNDSSQRELHDIAQEEILILRDKIFEVEKRIKQLLLPSNPNDEKPVIVEMRAAVGGSESEIFVANLFDAYKNYINNQKWKMKILNMSPTTHGYSFLVFEVDGKDVFAKLKFESGVHRVQRVPATEAKGRIHTSTVTVAVLPVQDDVDVVIDLKDLRIDTYRSSGAGGQHVNRTESAIRITHLPTGIVVACQEGKSQIENRATAMKMLKVKLWEKKEADAKSELSSVRNSQIGSGERSEKIRTYNYPQNRVTDHRINFSLSKLDQVMMGNLDEIIDALRADEQSKQMADLNF